MKRKSILLACLVLIVSGAFLTGCAGFHFLSGGPSAKNFKKPHVTLESVEVSHSFGYWYFSKKVKPTKGNPDNVGAPLELAFVFNVENLNSYPVLLEDIKFTIAFEEFDLNTVNSTATQWIPPGKTNQIMVPAHFDVRQSLLSLLVTGGFKLKAKKTNVWAQLEKWWTDIPNYATPIYVKGGAAIFQAGDLSEVATFDAVFP
ncbi:conserved exported hypothetical protein [Candidatus Desulfarcum epimagneticum]|uniref:Late embryogenesis abundant protein LEA-2 subgroup domain-containing protein n=1 Tax=uncultured Desulfobacteraceae bacterium TaxID=218296 RepID=A0A484HF51_9BACT|nr:conserved exported hypothetical protein [uncultured Desulfobacteraceae bacterium]